ncbi:Methyltransferase domain family [Synechococcus sp. PCC 7335]|uniref:class I SAM-dependent methyltransferase n=1 Tax=Synechococcus sp. (strain ATCC 29403 / PCC 7335) TaxID=91464 RepID=UPI00017EB93D|nr:class I SAM-dependent methyltransferase [Synechococcus sp. PCC 7335]EDX82393.1 Methyltransferase domain family [Synechococcus sp. PCC 7335]
MTTYDAIGASYAQTRQSDPRIAHTLLRILELEEGAIVADIGAGTGSYASVLANYGCQVIAVEPSTVMRSQAIAQPNIQWVDAYAEALPLSDCSVSAAIVMLALHHFKDYQQALREIQRITGGRKVVLFTYDPDAITRFWLTQYFPSFVEDVQATFRPIEALRAEVETITAHPVRVEPFPLPYDLSDSFAAVGWGRPELYLDNSIRNGISSFAKLSDRELEQGLSKLRKDVGTGLWDERNGHLRKQSQYDAGYQFLYTTRNSY